MLEIQHFCRGYVYICSFCHTVWQVAFAMICLVSSLSVSCQAMQVYIWLTATQWRLTIAHSAPSSCLICLCCLHQAHYHAVDRQHVQLIMTSLIKAGRLQQVPQHPSLVCMGNVLRQLSGQGSSAMHLDPMSHQDEPSHLFDNDKVLALCCCYMHSQT